MCGICGIIGSSQPGTIEAMADAIAHRGPDADGFYQQDNVSLGHRRLSIVDVQHGQQPMTDESGVVVRVVAGLGAVRGPGLGAARPAAGPLHELIVTKTTYW